MRNDSSTWITNSLVFSNSLMRFRKNSKKIPNVQQGRAFHVAKRRGAHSFTINILDDSEQRQRREHFLFTWKNRAYNLHRSRDLVFFNFKDCIDDFGEKQTLHLLDQKHDVEYLKWNVSGSFSTAWIFNSKMKWNPAALRRLILDFGCCFWG